MSLVTNAIFFAKEAHGRIDQRRKGTDEPYIVHPLAVLKLVQSVTDDVEMHAAAVLHDVVEDTTKDPVATLERIRVKFGQGVATLVDELTDVAKPEDGNRDVRVAINRAHTATISARAQTIKLADIIHNLSSIDILGEPFARQYRAEKLLLLEVMTKGNRRLWAEAYQLACAT